MAELIYHPKPAGNAGYRLPEPEAKSGGAAAEAPKAEPIAVRLASADAEKGKGGTQACQACHSFEKGGPNKVGPDLGEIVEREKAHAGLDDPRVVDVVREVIVRSSAQVYSVGELQHLARMLSAPEAQSLLEKSNEFEATLTRELFAAALTHPDLHRLLISP